MNRSHFSYFKSTFLRQKKVPFWIKKGTFSKRKVRFYLILLFKKVPFFTKRDLFYRLKFCFAFFLNIPWGAGSFFSFVKKMVPFLGANFILGPQKGTSKISKRDRLTRTKLLTRLIYKYYSQSTSNPKG